MKVKAIFMIEQDLKDKLIKENKETLVPMSGLVNKLIKNYFEKKEGDVDSISEL